MEDDGKNTKKSHRERNAGRKAEKKKSKKEAVNPVLEQTDKQRNPKAFAFNSAIRAERRFRRKQDIETKKQHVPLVDRTPIEPPPILIAVVGPPKVGKTTVINNLIRLFTKSPLTDIKGPVTIVTGKKRRITLIECNNDINSMIDIAKVADLVLLLCDASFGFEMEIFEFLNICQVHGMPRIMGVLTHLDMIKNSKTLKNTKKILKHRFWTEVYAGAKLFYLSGIVHGEYLRNEIKNLGRFISVIKFRPLTWRSTHSYLIGDRVEDLTNQEFIRQNPKCDRTISLYGYVRGVPLVKNCSVHVAGVGDFKIADISYLPDPCPLPETIKKRALVEKERLIYAPFSGVGGIVYDKDAVYVELGGSHSHVERPEDSMMSHLIDTKQTIDIKMKNSEMQIFTGGRKLTAKDVKEQKVSAEKSTVNTQKEIVDSDLDEELEELRNRKGFENVEVDGRTRRRVVFEQNDEEVAEMLRDSARESSDEDSESEDDSKKNETEYTILKENKDKKVHDVVSDALKYLNKKSWSSKKETITEESSDDLESSDEVSISSRESLVGVSRMKKRKDMIVDLRNDILEEDTSSESDCSEENKAINNNKTSNKLVNELNWYNELVKETNSENDSLEQEKKTSQMDSEETDSESDSSEDKLPKTTKIKKLSQRTKKNSQQMDSEDETHSESDSSEEISAQVNPKTKKSSLSKDLEEETNSESDSSEEHVSKRNQQMDPEEETNSESDEGLEDKSESEGDEDFGLKWKENLAKKARDAFLDRQKTTQNIMKLVYGVFDKHSGFDLAENEEDKDREEIGELFHLVTHEQKRLQEAKEKLNTTETSLFATWKMPTRDWLEPNNKVLIDNCFVTGKWKQSEDAQELLRLDDMEVDSDGSEVFGDFEDLETGEKHTEPDKSGKRKRDDEAAPEMSAAELVEKKRKLKEKFDAEYDNGEKSTYYDDLKTSAEKQAQLNKSVFENMSDELRVQIEGYRPGMYVRIEFEHVPSEFVTNFDATYPIVIGALNMGEENVGYVNVKIKKHRWYKKILKTNDPLIVSLGWRRFQTVPLYSKLEDDMKYRYLKYTPEHVQCNGHFWGPITPQGTGLLAVQTCNSDPESVKKQGFRIAATGSVQELDKSTQIMKKLKLIGYPAKIYKKTAFIKDMFNSSLEVAKFEGASIKTVSGIRGQIKKGVSKPEGTFRATFEDKIQLSDIVFCRTWYRVEVPHFYCPVSNLLLPVEQKNAWKGARTVGQLKRENGIRNEPAVDSLYTEIVRPPKVFKPLMIPRKLQKQLPYRDRPKFGPLKYDMKPDIEKKRVAVVREPHEQKVANMLKMLRASYENKQEKLKAAMSERVAKYQALAEAEGARKNQREKVKRKEVFRTKSKAKIREEKKGSGKRK